MTSTHTHLPTNDKLLTTQLQHGNKDAFEALVKQYQQRIFGLALKFTKNIADAEEVVQDVFISIFKKVNHFEGKSALSSWIYRITVNAALMRLRKQARHPSQSLDDLPSLAEFSQTHPPQANWEKSADDHVMQAELRQQLEHYTMQLPDKFKAIFLLKDVEGLSNQEIANIMDMSVPAVKSRLHRARLFLRDKLNTYLYASQNTRNASNVQGNS